MDLKIIDSCCLINLYAGGNPISIFEAFGGNLYVPRESHRESLQIRKPSVDPSRPYDVEPIDLRPAIDLGWIRECQIEAAAEADDFIALTTDLGDGEAACIAIAKSRGFTVATDDRRAIRFAEQWNVPTITTPELLKLWVEIKKPATDDIVLVLRNIEWYAKYYPPVQHTLHGWWRNYVP